MTQTASTRIPAGEILPFAEALKKALAPYCEQIEIAGSLRRKANQVKDIELVAIPKPCRARLEFGQSPKTLPKDALDAALLEMIQENQITADLGPNKRWGDRYKKFAILDGSGRPLPFTVDLFIVRPPAQWGPIFCIRTGPGGERSFNTELMVLARRRGLRQKDGRLIRLSDKQELQTPTEESYFAALGIPWIPPEHRSASKLRQLTRG